MPQYATHSFSDEMQRKSLSELRSFSSSHLPHHLVLCPVKRNSSIIMISSTIVAIALIVGSVSSVSARSYVLLAS